MAVIDKDPARVAEIERKTQEEWQRRLTAPKTNVPSRSTPSLVAIHPKPMGETLATAISLLPGEAGHPWTAAFRLLDLPSELRMRVYEFALAPAGVLYIAPSKNKKRTIRPVVSPQMLATCRQIHHEAREILLGENEVTITVNAHDTCWPTISEKRLPQPVLKRLLHFGLILDCTEMFNASYADVDFTSLEALTSLKTLRIAMVFRKHSEGQVLSPLHMHKLREFNAVTQILERVPSSAKVCYGTEEGTMQDRIVRELVALRGQGHGGIGTHGGWVEAAPATDLEAAARGVPDLVRGCRSGAAGNVCG